MRSDVKKSNGTESMKMMFKYKKMFFLLLTVGLIGALVLFPEQIFPTLAAAFIIFIVLFLIVEVVLDVYIIVAILLQKNKEK